MNEGKEPIFAPTFENGGFWEYYKDLERQFENYLEHVPYLQGNENTYSFRLANLILAIGAYVDSAFKEIARYTEFSKKYPQLFQQVSEGKPTIGDYYPLSLEYKLPKREVFFKCLPERQRIKPFLEFEKVGKSLKTPDWWGVYNGVKHRFKESFRQANLQNVRNALSGAFLLNAIHIPSAVRLVELGILKPTLTAQESYGVLPEERKFRITPEIVEDWLRKTRGFWGIVETPLFIYNLEELIQTSVKP
jgi:hypothetical protein